MDYKPKPRAKGTGILLQLPSRGEQFLGKKTDDSLFIFVVGDGMG